MSPSARLQLELCLGAAEEAIRVLGCTCNNMAQTTSTLATCTDSFAYRGKIRSLLDAGATTAAHVHLLLSDASTVCGSTLDGSADDLKACVLRLQEELRGLTLQLDSSTEQLQAALRAKPLLSQGMLNMQLTQMQKQLATTAGLDGALRAVGSAYAALLALSHREGIAVTRQFLQDTSSCGGPAQAPPGSSGAAPAPQPTGPQGGVCAGVVPTAASKVLKLGDCSMKRLRNGDLYKVCRDCKDGPRPRCHAARAGANHRFPAVTILVSSHQHWHTGW